MRVLIDECAPRALKRSFLDRGHECRTVQEMGWTGKKNGALLDLAEPTFNVLITLDTNLSYQQNLTGRSIAIVVLESPSNRLEHLRPLFPVCVAASERVARGGMVRVSGEYEGEEPDVGGGK